MADIAESHGGDIARVVYYELFLASHVAEDARMIWYNQIISHMVTICHSHPQLLSDTLQLTHRCVCNFMKNGDIIEDEEKKFTNVYRYKEISTRTFLLNTTPSPRDT